VKQIVWYASALSSAHNASNSLSQFALQNNVRHRGLGNAASAVVGGSSPFGRCSSVSLFKRGQFPY
jgi:hypothetical protein